MILMGLSVEGPWRPWEGPPAAAVRTEVTWRTDRRETSIGRTAAAAWAGGQPYVHLLHIPARRKPSAPSVGLSCRWTVGGNDINSAVTDTSRGGGAFAPDDAGIGLSRGERPWLSRIDCRSENETVGRETVRS
jgi:hypothetical protein